MSTEPNIDLRCSVQTKGLGEQPAGSATAADHFLLVELPMPWPAKIENHPVVAALPSRPEGAPTLRVLGIRKADDDALEHHRIISYQKDPTQLFTGYEGHEVDVATGDLEATLAAVAVGDRAGLRPMAHDQVDVLLCTHGTRDRCCGQLGTLLFAEVCLDPRPNVRFWRTSHTGGHRFAPTGITFPDGLTWAFLDGQTLGTILDRSVEPSTLVNHFRGCAGMGSRPAQVADAALFERAGWSWLDQPRKAAVRSSSDGTHEVLLSVGDERFTVSLSEGEPLPVPVCAEPLDAATKSAPQLVISGISQHA